LPTATLPTLFLHQATVLNNQLQKIFILFLKLVHGRILNIWQENGRQLLTLIKAYTNKIHTLIKAEFELKNMEKKKELNEKENYLIKQITR